MLLLSIWNTYLGNDLWKADVCTMLCCKYWNSLLFTGPTQVSEKSWLLSGLREDRWRTNFLRVTSFALKLMDIMLKSGIRMSIEYTYMYVIWVCQLTTVKVPCVCCHSAGSFQVLHLQLRNSLGRYASQTCFEEWQTRRYGLRIPAAWANWALDGHSRVTVKPIGIIKWKFFELSRIRNQDINNTYIVHPNFDSFM